MAQVKAFVKLGTDNIDLFCKNEEGDWRYGFIEEGEGTTNTIFWCNKPIDTNWNIREFSDFVAGSSFYWQDVSKTVPRDTQIKMLYEQFTNKQPISDIHIYTDDPEIWSLFKG
jgi:hypothetical protein